MKKDNFYTMCSMIKSECCCCYENLDENGQQPCKLSCGHFNHISCLCKWTNDRLICPYCRQVIQNLNIETVAKIEMKRLKSKLFSKLNNK